MADYATAPLPPPPPPPSSLPPELQILSTVPLITTSRADGTALAYQIAHVQAKSRQEDPGRVLRLLQALQLLARLAQTDARQWEDQVARLWPASARKLISRRHHALHLASANIIGLVFRVRNVEEIEGLADHRHGTTQNGHNTTQIPVGLVLRFVGVSVGDALGAIRSLATPPSTGEPRAYRIASVRDIRQAITSIQRLDQFAELADRGVAIHELPRLHLQVTEQNASQIVRNLHLLFTKRRPGSPPTVQQVNMMHDPIRLDPVAAMLLSAIGESSSVREFTAYISLRNVEGVARPTVMQWLAFSLFSLESRHKIRRLDLKCLPQDAFSHQQVLDVLQADDPVAALFPECADSVAQHANMRLAASEFVLFDPEGLNDNTSERLMLTDHPHEQLRILDETSKWWIVLLPAWGRAWVRKADAVATANTSIAATRHLIRDISFSVHTTEALRRSLSWLTLVGSGAKVVSLSLDAVSSWSFAWGDPAFAPSPVALDWIDARTAFPNVQKLRISQLHVSSLCTLADWIGDPDSRLHHLRLFNVTVINEGGGIPAFLDIIGDEHHPAAKKLQSLVVDASHWSQPQPEIVAAALRMLTTNSYLRSFVIHLRPHAEQTADTLDYARVKAAFAAHKNTPLRTDICKRLALVSALYQSCDGILRGLDRSIVGDIFHLAGLVHRRLVKVHILGL